LLTATKDVI